MCNVYLFSIVILTYVTFNRLGILNFYFCLSFSLSGYFNEEEFFILVFFTSFFLTPCYNQVHNMGILKVFLIFLVLSNISNAHDDCPQNCFCLTNTIICSLVNLKEVPRILPRNTSLL